MDTKAGDSHLILLSGIKVNFCRRGNTKVWVIPPVIHDCRESAPVNAPGRLTFLRRPPPSKPSQSSRPPQHHPAPLLRGVSAALPQRAPTVAVTSCWDAQEWASHPGCGYWAPWVLMWAWDSRNSLRESACRSMLMLKFGHQRKQWCELGPSPDCHGLELPGVSVSLGKLLPLL